MKVTIDLEELKKFINALDPYPDEWYGKENYMTGSCIREFLEFNGNKKIAKEFGLFLTELNKDTK